MRANPKRHIALLASASVLGLSGCGGGGLESMLSNAVQNAINQVTGSLTPPAGSTTGSTAASGSGAAAPGATTNAVMQALTKLVFSGTVATGAPMVGATVKVFDATGAELCSQTVGADGTYSCEIAAGSVAPYVVVATRDDMKLVSVQAQATSGTVNVTPLTNMIAATLSTSGDPAKLVDEVKAAPAMIDPAKLRASVEMVMTALKPLLDTLGTNTDPISGRFDANGTGHDQLLDLLQVTVRPEAGASGTAANIEVTVRARPTAADAPPVSIAFRSNQQTVPALNPAAVTAAAIPAAGENVAMLTADFLTRMNACYALPQATRVTAGTSPTSTVQAPACRGLFADDNPATYLHSSGRVGPSGAFKGMFGTTTGVVFDRPNFDYMRTNGDYVISYRWTAPNGSSDFDQLVVRKQGDRFKAIGNQYIYDSRVRSFAQRRDLINTPSFSSISTGYNIWIANRTNASGQPVFSKVEVTTPKGDVLTYLPSPGMGWLVRAKSDGTPSGTPVLRLAGRWLDPANTTSVAEKESGLLLINPQLTDDQLRQLPDQSVWRLEFFHVDGSANVIQTHRTTSRALTLGEIAATPFAEVVPAAREALKQETGATGRYTFTDTPSAGSPSWVDLAMESAGGSAPDFWRVPAGAVPPTSVTLFGFAPGGGVRFSDSVNILSTARTAQIRCSAQSVGDTHCDATLRDQFAVGSTVNALELWARNSRQVELSTLIGLYKLQ